jgi:hypothetical protein
LGRGWGGVVVDVEARRTLFKGLDITATAKEVLDRLKTKLSFFSTLDSSIRVEVALLEALTGTQGEKITEEKVLTKFATASIHTGIEHTLASLLQMGASPDITGLGQRSMHIVEVATNLLQQMVRGIAPSSAVYNTEFGTSLLDRASLFLVCESGPNKLKGKEAVAPMLKALQAKHADPTKSVTMQEIQQMKGFEFVMTEPERSALNELCSALVDKVRVSVPGPKTKAKAKDAIADVMALFG